MTGQKLVKNLIRYLQSVSDISCFDVPIYEFSSNEEKKLPGIVVGYDSENTSISGGMGHYTVSGFVSVSYQGYDDLTNSNGDGLSETIVNALLDKAAMFRVVNKPFGISDSRPCKQFTLNGLITRSCEREIDGHSTNIVIKFDAWCVMKDF